MAFNITGGVTVTNSVARNAPNTPTDVTIARTNNATANLTWLHTANPSAPHSGFRIDYAINEATPTYETLSAVTPTAISVDANGVSSYQYTVSGIADFRGSYLFTVTATAATVGTDAVNSAASTAVTLASLTPATPDTVRVNDTTVNDQKRITWNYTSSEGDRTSHFELQCVSRATNDPTGLTAATDWTTIATIPAQATVANTTTEYAFTQSGYDGETNFLFYSVRAVFRNGIEGSYSTDYSDPFNPFDAVVPTGVTFTRDTVNTAEIAWTIPTTAVSFVQAFKVERSIDGVNYVPQATITAEDNTTGAYSLEITGLDAEGSTIHYRVRSIGVNGTISGPSAVVDFVPVVPNGPSNFMASVNSGVGLVTSIALTWTAPVVGNTSNVASYLLEYRRSLDAGSTFEQVGTYAADITNAEILPPQQGALELRISVVGVNGLNSTTVPTLNLNVAPGSATDDSIYNGDEQYIATRNFSDPSESFCLDYQVNPTPFAGLDLANSTYTTFQAPVETAGSEAPGFIEGAAGQDTIIEWVFDVQQRHVDRRTHFWLDLSGIEHINSPTRDWSINSDDVILEIISDPTVTNRFFDSPPAGHMYFGTTGNLNPTNNVRHFGLRSTGQGGDQEPMFVSRVQIRLSMREVFTFRAAGTARLRLIMLADAVGHPRIPVSGIATNAQATTPICFDAYESGQQEAGTFTLVGLTADQATQQIVTYEKAYRTVPTITTGTSFVNGQPSGLAIVWHDADLTQATFSVVPTSLGAIQAPTSVKVDYNIRGY